MTAGNVADGEGHGQKRQPKRQRYAQETDAQIWKGRVRNCGAAAAMGNHPFVMTVYYATGKPASRSHNLEMPIRLPISMLILALGIAHGQAPAAAPAPAAGHQTARRSLRAADLHQLNAAQRSS